LDTVRGYGLLSAGNEVATVRFIRGSERDVPDTMTVVLHPKFRSDCDIDLALRRAIFRAADQRVKALAIIPGKGSGTLKRRVLARLNHPHLRKLYRVLQVDPTNDGCVLLRF
jgi:hypothetical protein